MKITLRALVQKTTLMATAFILAVSTLTAAVPFILSEKASAVGATTIATTDLAADGWDLSETRSAGHNELVNGGLHVWTEPSGGSYPNEFSKAAGYHLAQPGLLLEDVDSTAINFVSFSGVRPSVQLGIDRDGNGSWDGYLVYEPWAYGNGQYWTNKTGFGVPGTADYPSLGTLDQYQAANPNAKVLTIGYSLGSGVVGDAIISSIVIGDTTYTFSAPAPAPEFVKLDSYYKKDTYKGLGVDIKVDHLIDATSVEVKVDRTNGGPVIKTAKQSVLSTLNSGATAQVTAPIVFQQVSYNEAGSGSWNLPNTTSWDYTTVPTNVTVTITRANGDTLVKSQALGETVGPFATLSEVMPVYVNELPVVSITTPAVNGVASTTLPSSLNYLTVKGTFTDNKAPNYLQLELVHAGNLVKVGYVYGSMVNPDGTFIYAFNVPSNLQNGEYSLFYTGTDFENGVTTRYERVFTIDNTAPNISWQKQPDAIYGAGEGFHVRPITSEVGTLKQIYIDSVDEQNLIRELDDNNKNFDTKDSHNVALWASLAEGTHKFIAVFTDHAGNSTTSTSKEFVIDRTGPTITVQPSSIGSNGIYSKVGFDFFDKYMVDYVVINNASGSFTTDLGNNKWSNLNDVAANNWYGVVEGANTITVFDVAGNSTTLDFVIDRDAPVVSLTGATDGEIYNAPVTIEGLVDDLNPSHYFLTVWKDGVKVNISGITGQRNATNFSYTFTNDAAYKLLFEARDLAGNKDASSVVELSFTLDQVAPSVAISSLTPQRIEGTAGLDATIVLTIDGDDVAQFAPEADGTWAYDFSPALGEGDHDVKVTVVDAAGNASFVTGSLTVLPIEDEDTTEEPQTVVNIDNTPQTPPFPPAIGPAANQDVQGASDENTAGVEGDSTVKTPAQAVDSDANQGNLLGLAWYWWILIIAALAAAAWWIVGAIRRRQAE